MEDRRISIANMEAIRQELHRIIDAQVDDFIRHHIIGEAKANSENGAVNYGLLSSKTSIFKGTKPVSVVFSDGHIESTNTWKKVVLAILRDCNFNEAAHYNLMAIRGKVFGNFRSILSDSPDNLKAPIKIDEGLYFEAKYDTETLLYVLKKRVLDVVGYNYATIMIQYIEKQ